MFCALYAFICLRVIRQLLLCLDSDSCPVPSCATLPSLNPEPHIYKAHSLPLHCILTSAFCFLFIFYLFLFGESYPLTLRGYFWWCAVLYGMPRIYPGLVTCKVNAFPTFYPISPAPILFISCMLFLRG